MKTKPINQSQAITICREIENILIPLGYHCALGGGCLHQEGERKDVDVLVYPHDINASNLEHKLVVEKLKANLTIGTYKEKASTTDKEVYVGSWNNEFRVDLFFLSK